MTNRLFRSELSALSAKPTPRTADPRHPMYAARLAAQSPPQNDAAAKRAKATIDDLAQLFATSKDYSAITRNIVAACTAAPGDAQAKSMMQQAASILKSAADQGAMLEAFAAVWEASGQAIPPADSTQVGDTAPNPGDTTPAMAAASGMGLASISVPIIPENRHLASFAPDGSGFAVLTSPPPRAPSRNAHGLTDQQIAICKETGCPPETFARLSAGR